MDFYGESRCESDVYRVNIRGDIFEIPYGYTISPVYPYDVLDGCGNVRPAKDFRVGNAGVEQNDNRVSKRFGDSPNRIMSVLQVKKEDSDEKPNDREEYFGDKYIRIEEYNKWKEYLELQKDIKEDVKKDIKKDVKKEWKWLINNQKFKEKKQKSLWMEYVEKKIFKLIRDNEPDFNDREYKRMLDKPRYYIKIPNRKSMSIFGEIKELRGSIWGDKMESLIFIVEEIKKIKQELKKGDKFDESGDTNNNDHWTKGYYNN